MCKSSQQSLDRLRDSVPHSISSAHECKTKQDILSFPHSVPPDFPRFRGWFETPNDKQTQIPIDARDPHQAWGEHVSGTCIYRCTLLWVV